MLLTVTTNPAIDRTYTVPGFALGKVNRPIETLLTAGGKGVNVARAFRTLQGDASVTGFLGKENGEKFSNLLKQAGLSSEWTTVSGEIRTCYQFYDPETGLLTEINEAGPSISDADCELLTHRLLELLPHCRAVVFSGSLPPSVRTDLYRDWILLAQDSFGIPAILDTSGEPLSLGITAKPFLVKPNVHELKALNLSFDHWVLSARAIRERFATSCAIVTNGSLGAAISTSDGDWEVVSPPVKTVSALGSGDTLTAGFLWAWLNGMDWPDALTLGVAAATANTLSLGAGFFSREQVDEIAAQTTVRRLSGKT